MTNTLRRGPGLGMFLAAGVLFLFLLPVAASAVNEQSKLYNNLGMEHYEKGDLIAACGAFHRAIAADRTNYLAHYNLACSLTLLRRDFDPKSFEEETGSGFSIGLDTIFRHLETAAGLHGGRKTRMLEDPDLQALHRTLRFHTLAGRTLTNPWHARTVLPAVNWSLFEEAPAGAQKKDPKKGWPVPDGTISFTLSGGFRLQLWSRGLEGTGSYRIENGRVLLRFEEGGFNREGAEAALGPEGADFGDLGGFAVKMRNPTAE